MDKDLRTFGGLLRKIPNDTLTGDNDKEPSMSETLTVTEMTGQVTGTEQSPTHGNGDMIIIVAPPVVTTYNIWTSHLPSKPTISLASLAKLDKFLLPNKFSFSQVLTFSVECL